MIFCKYKNILGKPNHGIHKTRIFGLALFDIIFTIIGAYFFNKYFEYNNFYLILIIFIVIGEFFHYLFCVDTPIIKLINQSLLC